MKHGIASIGVATALLLAVEPAHGFGRVGSTVRETPVVVAPQQTFVLPHGQALIVSRPILLPQRASFIPAGVVVPSSFIPFLAFHRHFGHVILFVEPTTFAVSPSGFWWWSGAGWTWVAQPIAW